jgi:hypothetical protein
MKVEKVAYETVSNKIEKVKKPPKPIEDPSSSKNALFAEYLILDESKHLQEEKVGDNASRPLSEGEAVEGLYNGSIGQTDWYPAKISKVHKEGCFDIIYDEPCEGKLVKVLILSSNR